MRSPAYSTTAQVYFMFGIPENERKGCCVRNTGAAEKEMQKMKNLWKKYLIVTTMTVVLGLTAGCGNVTDDRNNNQNNTQDENKNNTDDSQVPAGDNNGTAPDTNKDKDNNMNSATSGEDGVDENGKRLDENGNIIEDLGEDVGEGIKDVGDGIGEGVEDLTGGGSRDVNQQNAR